MADRPERTPVGDRVTISARGKKKIYVADFWFDDRHHRKSLKTANKKIALNRASALNSKLGSGAYHLPPAPTTIADAASAYVAHLVTLGRARRTIVKYKGIYKVFAAFLAEQRITKLSQFTAISFDKFLAFLALDLVRKTLYNYGVIIKQVFKWSKSRKLIVENPIADYKLEKPPLIPKPGPSLAEVDAILSTFRGETRVMIALLAFAGKRAGELQRLQPDDVDIAGNWIHIVSRQGLETKTGLSRTVPIHPRLRELLMTLPKTKKPWLFTMPPSRKYPKGDNMLNVKRLNDEFKKVVESLKMPAGRENGYTLHSLRHFFETFTVNAGIPQRVVDAWLGHHSDKSMAAVYYKLRDEDSQNFMMKVPFGTGAAAAEAVEEV